MNNQSGFSLLSLMMTLGVFSVTIFLIIQVIPPLVKQWQEDVSPKKDVYLFFEQTAMEVHGADRLSCESSDALYIYDGENKISFGISGNRVYRQVNDKGFDIVLQHVRSIAFSCKENAVMMTVVDTEGSIDQWADVYFASKAGAS
ncbi:competence protein ComGF [Scopulibacillus darangshiensis]|uniref:Competence protein ComGF n=1 Tax=Scopulibacillus darangshiensis TaxID=442528 RepID=A0A4R2PB79_9BACL|nr:ComGF family competence protein [Scopulibacillus darangshiensis]TCP31155.1 competence protein ComGF [Scopulibacillus darangshiensis]